jgi:hypothetical protein
LSSFAVKHLAKSVELMHDCFPKPFIIKAHAAYEKAAARIFLFYLVLSRPQKGGGIEVGAQVQEYK